MNILALDPPWKSMIIVSGKCPTCGEVFVARRRYRKTNPARQQIFCSRQCYFKSPDYRPPHKKGDRANNWKGGISMDGHGYLIHTAGDNYGRAVHRVIAEKALERKLKRNETVHHIDGDKLNNKNSNLLICTVQYHSWLEKKMARLYQLEHLQEVSH